jgi:hypothetical protein
VLTVTDTHFRGKMIAIASAGLIAGCLDGGKVSDTGTEDSRPERRIGTGNAEPRALKRDDAIVALRALIWSIPEGLSKFDADKLIQEADQLEKQSNHLGPWGRFHLVLSERSYAFSVGYGPSSRVCTCTYRGSFEFQQGRWVALPPVVQSSTLGAH